jgi:hypothetical protein
MGLSSTNAPMQTLAWICRRQNLRDMTRYKRVVAVVWVVDVIAEMCGCLMSALAAVAIAEFMKGLM